VLTATGFVNGKGQFSTPYRIDTPQPITKKFVTGDYVGDRYGCAKLGAYPSMSRINHNNNYNYNNTQIIIIMVDTARCVIVSNFVKIGQTAAEIWRFFDFLRWRPQPSWIFESSNFYPYMQ